MARLAPAGVIAAVIAAVLALLGAAAASPAVGAQDPGDTGPPLVTVTTPSQQPDASRIVAVLRGPGGVGYWIIGADGTIEPIGTSILPIVGEPPEFGARVVGARLGAPGALGVWMRLADGSEVAVGDPGPTVLTGEERPLGWLSGIGVRQVLSGAWWSDVDRWCAGELSQQVRIGQTIMPSLAERSLGFAVEEARDRRIGGIRLRGAVTEHVWRRIDELQDFAARIPLLIAANSEGGSVQPLASVVGRLASAASQTSSNPADVASRAERHARKMAEAGFTMNLAPVLDVDTESGTGAGTGADRGADRGAGIGDRSFGDDPATVAQYGTATVLGLSAGGVVPVVKHFPGHGGARADDPETLAVTAPLEQLRRRDLIPFAAVIGMTDAAVMVGHLVVPSLSGGLPASMSHSVITGLLRDDLGHDGLVVTDSLDAPAVAGRWPLSEAAPTALAAGADLVLVGGLDDATAAFSAIEAALASERLSEARLNQAASNVLRAKGVYACTLIGRDGPSPLVLADPTLTRR